MNDQPVFQWTNESTPLSIVTQTHTLPETSRPDLTSVSEPNLIIPIIDMGTDHDEAQIVEAIVRACQEFGFFHVTNHGIPVDLCQKVLDEISKLFELPNEEKCHLVTDKHMEDGKIFKYYLKENGEKISMWAESFFHTWNPNSDHPLPLNLPENPPLYREVVGEYTRHMGILISKLLSLISQGLGLESDYLRTRLGDEPAYTAQANYYPPCPNPELTIGLIAHTDYNVLTVLLQEDGVTGLHVFKDQKWVAVDPIPGSLVVNVADQLQVLSNDKYKSVLHRAVTNEERKRVSFATFVGPDYKASIGPIPELINEAHPALYHNYTFDEFVQEFRNQQGKPRKVKEFFRICTE